MPIIGPQRPLQGLFFRDLSNISFTWNRPAKRFYENHIFRPFAKIRLIWAFFETESDMGSVWVPGRAIRAQIKPGLV